MAAHQHPSCRPASSGRGNHRESNRQGSRNGSLFPPPRRQKALVLNLGRRTGRCQCLWRSSIAVALSPSRALQDAAPQAYAEPAQEATTTSRSDGRMSCPLLTLAGTLAHHHGGGEDRFGLSLRLVPWRGLQISVLMQMIGADELMRTTSGPGSAQSLTCQ